MPEFYIANKDEDLIAKELQYHQSCYRSFTRGFSQNYREGASKEPESRELTEETNTGDFESVKEYIRRQIFELKQAVSMTILHSIYGLNVDDTRYRSKLKTRILREFSDRLTFFTVHAHKPEIVFDSTLPAHEIDFQNKNGCIMKAADYLREEILQYRDNLPELSWPPQIEDPQSDNRKPPENLLRFLSILMQADQSNTNSNINRMINSYAWDMIHGVTRGRVMTEKHVLLGLGLHNMTGQHNIVKIAHRFGHSISYNTVCEIETEQAMKAQELSSRVSVLPIIPQSDDEYALTYFWVDNFDIKFDKTSGAGSVHTTHLAAFQEINDGCMKRTNIMNLQRARSRTMECRKLPNNTVVVDPKVEPIDINSTIILPNNAAQPMFLKYFMWLWQRKENGFDQVFSNFSGWLVSQRPRENLMKTVVTFFPPIPSKVTSFATTSALKSFYCLEIIQSW